MSEILKKARSHERKGDWAAAAEEYKKLQSLDPCPPIAFNLLGDLYHRKGDGEAAYGWYQQALERYAQEGLYGNAIGVCRKILRQDPARVDTFEQLGGLFFSQGLAREAVKHYLDYASQMLRKGDTIAVRKTAERVREVLPTDCSVRERVAELFLSLSLPGEAIEDLRSAHAGYQGNGSIAEAERIAEKIRELEKELPESARSPAPPPPEEEPHEAEPLTAEPPVVEPVPGEPSSIESAPPDPSLLDLEEEEVLPDSEIEESTQGHFPRQELTLPGEEEPATSSLADGEEEGEERAPRPIEEILGPEHPAEEAGGKDEGPVPRAQEEDDFVPVDEILREFQDGVEKILDEKDYQSHYDMGMSFKEMGLYEEALSEFEHVSPSPELRGASEEMRATILLELGRAKEAALVLEGLIEDGEGDSLGVHFLLGRSHEDLGDFEKALQEYRFVEERDPGFQGIRERIAKIRK